MISIDYPVKTEGGSLVNVFPSDKDFLIDVIREDAEILKISQSTSNIMTMETDIDMTTTGVQINDAIEIVSDLYNGIFQYAGGEGMSGSNFTFNVIYEVGDYIGDEGNGSVKIGFMNFFQEWRLEVLPVNSENPIIRILNKPLLFRGVNNKVDVFLNSLKDKIEIIKRDTRLQDVLRIKLLFRERHRDEEISLEPEDHWFDISNNLFKLNSFGFMNPSTIEGDFIYIINSSRRKEDIFKTYNSFISDFDFPFLVRDYEHSASFLMNKEKALDEGFTFISFSATRLDHNFQNPIAILPPEEWLDVPIITGIYNLNLNSIDLENTDFIELDFVFKESPAEFESSDYNSDYTI